MKFSEAFANIQQIVLLGTTALMLTLGLNMQDYTSASISLGIFVWLIYHDWEDKK
jgi:hypothetical protein